MPVQILGSPVTSQANLWSAQQTLGDNVLLRLGGDGDFAAVLNSAGLSADEELAGVIVGTSDHQGTDLDSLILSDITVNGDILGLVNNDGNSLEWLFVDASAKSVMLGHAMTDVRLLTAAVLGTGEGGVTAPTGNTFRAPDAATGGAGNVAGADLTIAAGLGTGTGDEGTIIFSLPIVAAAGDNIQTRATRLTLDMVGSSTVLTMSAAQALTISTVAGALGLTSGDGAVNVTTGSGAADDFTVNATQFVVEGDTGYVGIGTATPTKPLNIVKSMTDWLVELKNTHATAGHGLQVQAGDSNSERIAGFQDKDGNDRVSFYAGGQAVFHAGNVGIGTTAFGTSATYNLALGGGATTPVLGAATADIVHLAAVDVAAGNRQLYIQSETGSPIRLGADALTFGAAADIVAPAATAAALEISNGTVKMLALDTRATTDNIAMLLVTSIPPTFASAAASTYHLVESSAFVLTLTGQVAAPTDLRGLVLSLGAPTVTDASAITPTRASTVYIPAITYGGSVTPSTTDLIIDTSVAGCYLTAAGVWTDASTRTAKQDIRTLGVDVPWDDVLKDIQEAQSVSFRKIDPSDGGWQRYGVIAEDVPTYLAMPDRQGVASMYLAGAAFAGVQALIYENEQLKLRIAKLEGARA